MNTLSKYINYQLLRIILKTNNCYKNWRKGGKMAKTYIDRKGYKMYFNSGKSVHRQVAKRKLGGKIWKGYVVHHKDGNKRNNRRSNLLVM